MKLLVINANTSAAITAKVEAAARAAADAETEIVAVTADFGARVISTRSENAIAMHAAVELGARHHAGCDAVVVAVSLDTGAAALRELLPIPVVGMTEAACLMACTVGGRFGVVTLGTRVVPLYAELVASVGLERRLAGVRAVDIQTRDYDDVERVDEAVAGLAQALIAEDGAEAIVLAGAAIAGRHALLAPRVPVPVLDGVSCGVELAQVLARLKPAKPRTGSYAAPGAKVLVKVDESLKRLFE